MAKQRDERNELRVKGKPELLKLLAAHREELRDLRFRVASKQHKDIRELREVRYRIARILTLLRQHEMNSARRNVP